MKPIIFGTESVQAIQGDRKGMTRRVIVPQPPKELPYPYGFITGSSDKKEIGKFAWTVGEICDGRVHSVRPRYRPSDIAWVRETWKPTPYEDGVYAYKADRTPEPAGCQYLQWRSPYYMPRAAARIFLRVTDVRVERLQEISENDAKAEGIKSYWLTKEACKNADDWHESNSPPFIGAVKEMGADLCSTRREAYQQLWDSLNAKRGHPWESNPWVWVYGFERISREEAETL